MDLPYANTESKSRLEQCTIASAGTYSEHFDDETLLYVESGDFLLQSVSAHVPASTGSLVLIRPGEVLVRCNNETAPARIVLVSFGSQLLHHFVNRYGDLIAQAPRVQQTLPDAFEITPTPLLQQSLEHLFALAQVQHPEEVLELRFEEILLLLLVGDRSHTIASIIRQKTHRTTDRLRLFMDRHFKNDWKLEDFAREFGASLTTFKESFSEVFGLSPRAWISERRLLYAHQLLLSSEMSIVDVAAEAGFSSQSYFTQSYKRRFGETPSQTRKASLTQTHIPAWEFSDC